MVLKFNMIPQVIIILWVLVGVFMLIKDWIKQGKPTGVKNREFKHLCFKYGMKVRLSNGEVAKVISVNFELREVEVKYNNNDTKCVSITEIEYFI